MLLKENAEILSATQGAAEGRDSYIKALSLLTESGIRNKGPFDPAHDKAIDFIAEKLRGSEVPVHTLKKLFCYYELVREYGKAAIILLSVVEKEPSFVKEAIRFYKGLSEKSDKELLDGNFSKEEVEAGLRKLTF